MDEPLDSLLNELTGKVYRVVKKSRVNGTRDLNEGGVLTLEDASDLWHNMYCDNNTHIYIARYDNLEKEVKPRKVWWDWTPGDINAR